MTRWNVDNPESFPNEMSVADFIARLNGEAIDSDAETPDDSRTKFNTRSIEGEDGLKFDSVLERKWWQYLKQAELMGHIRALSLHPQFLIGDSVFPRLKRGRFVQSLKYTADFRWVEDYQYTDPNNPGKMINTERNIVVDVKGYAGKAGQDGVLSAGGVITDAVLLRVRLFLMHYGEDYIFRMVIGKPGKAQVWEFDVLHQTQTFYDSHDHVLRQHTP